MGRLFKQCLQGQAHALLDLVHGLSARHTYIGRIFRPGSEERRVLVPHGHHGLPFKVTLVQLHESRIELQRHVPLYQQWLGSLSRTKQWAAPDGRQWQGSQCVGKGLGLLDAMGIERGITVTVEPVLAVEMCLPMPDEQKGASGGVQDVLSTQCIAVVGHHRVDV